MHRLKSLSLAGRITAMRSGETKGREAQIPVAGTNGRLQVIATPIGNLADLSARAREALAGAHVIAAEDTRHTGALLRAEGITTPLVSLHAHNEAQRTPALLAHLAAGETVALVSDAGTPLISDPGFELVRSAVAAGFEVSAIPGPCAITAALAVAALPTERFCFEGFLPARQSERRGRLTELAREPRTLVFFEAPHRIAATLANLAEHFGAQRQAVLARELTKVHETIYRGTLAELSARARTEANLARGEITLVVHGAPAPAAGVDEALLRRSVELLAGELPPARIAVIAAQLSGATRAAAYALVIGTERPAGTPAGRRPRNER
jgi:16S rRNA (cytidine1402-2'-O)-methyltransferase